MVGIFSKLFGKDTARTDATRIYHAALAQSRRPEFYESPNVADNYDGRIDMLSLHLAVIIRALNTHGEQGKRLAQALYEVMRDDWDIALREEGLSDTGVMKRIKPMISLFYTRLKAYTERVEAENETNAPLTAYAKDLAKRMDGLSLGQIAMVDFSFPTPPTFGPPTS